MTTAVNAGSSDQQWGPLISHERLPGSFEQRSLSASRTTTTIPCSRRIGDARLVLVGEASHGAEEFYRERARITRHLIAEKGFCAVAVEADWRPN
jgi:erythromycin esterase-like protein